MGRYPGIIFGLPLSSIPPQKNKLKLLPRPYQSMKQVKVIWASIDENQKRMKEKIPVKVKKRLELKKRGEREENMFSVIFPNRTTSCKNWNCFFFGGGGERRTRLTHKINLKESKQELIFFSGIWPLLLLILETRTGHNWQMDKQT